MNSAPDKVGTDGGGEAAPQDRIARFDNDGKPVLMRLPKVHFIDDKAGKPVGINQFMGRWPIVAFGNSARDIGRGCATIEKRSWPPMKPTTNKA